LCDQARGVPRGARCQLFAFQKNHIFPTQFGKVIGNGTADNATPDNDNACFVWECRHGFKPYESKLISLWHKMAQTRPSKTSLLTLSIHQIR
jgi:hypothetical protein